MIRSLKYSKLKAVMLLQGIKQSELCKKLKKSQTWLTNRFAGDGCFTIDEGYAILDVLGIPHDKLAEYFPPGGYPEPNIN